MAIFRDLEGNFFNVPDEDLEKYRVEGELPENAELSGQEASARGFNPGASRYIWPPIQTHYIWEGPFTGFAGLAVNPQAHNYPGPGMSAPSTPAAQTQQGYRGGAYAYPTMGQAAYNWEPPMGQAAYNWEPPTGQAAYNYVPPGQAAYNYQDPTYNYAKPAYNWEPPSAQQQASAYNYEPPGGQRQASGYNYEPPSGQRQGSAYNYEPPGGSQKGR